MEPTQVEYEIPSWCKMPLGHHHDGIGGCWGISYGYVAREGEKYCQNCEYYRQVKEATNEKKRI